MPDEGRIQQLLEEMLERDCTPEEVCSNATDLLPEIRARWARVCRVANQLDELFPGSGSFPRTDSVVGEDVVPQITGYRVEAILGRGGMGVVFKAQQLKPNRPVAVKMLLAGPYAGPQELARFLREIEAVATLQHPNIVQIHEVSEHAGRPYFTMELVEGGSLAQHLARALPSPLLAAELVATLAVTVQFAHKSGIIHRDLKPANILLAAPLSAESQRASGQPSWGVPKIADFGLACFVNAEPELTLSGARLGTPGYMAPEQSLGKTAEIGPASDIYSLGVILYEALAGRTPFEGATAAETERRVISEEPAPPSRFNAKVPRDLDTICLKCLHKNPSRRYASAQDLADDLHRFLDGKPVLARPVGPLERGVKWARRHPTAATLTAALLVLVGMAGATGVWLQQQQNDRRVAKEQQQRHAHNAIETALRRVDELRQQERWRDAKLILTEAATQLAVAESPLLEKQFRRAESDIQFASDLDRVREGLFYLPDGKFDFQQQATEYQKLFDRTGLRISDELDTIAASILASAIGPQIVAALEHWAYNAHKLADNVLAARLLQLARSVDPEPSWRDQFRDTAAWTLPELKRLANTAFATSPPPTEKQLALLGLMLREVHGGYRNTELLAKACQRHPSNFWLNREMGDASFTDDRLHEAAGFYRAALALRPENAVVNVKLGHVLLKIGQTEEALAAYRRAAVLDPSSYFRGQLIRSLAVTGYWKDAEAECQKVMETDPTDTRVPSDLANLLQLHGWEDRGLALFRKVVEVGANDANVLYSFGMFLLRSNRDAEGLIFLRKAVDLDPHSLDIRHQLARGLVVVGRSDEAIAEFQILISHAVDKTWYRRDLGLLLIAQDRSAEALTELRKAVENRSQGGPPWDTLATAALAEGSFAEALDATKRVRGIGIRPRKFCRLLLSTEKQLPAILAGKEQVTDAATARALAEWCWKHKRLTAAAARFYAMAFALDPSVTTDEEVNHRLSAACAAALAGSGVGNDAITLSDAQRAGLRKQAFDWLTAEYGTCEAEGNKTIAANVLRSWQRSKDLAAVRDEKALAKLPPNERREWQAIWAKVAKLVEQDPAAKIAQARAHVAQNEWKQAADCYSAAFELEPTDDSHVWFEYAACQLLAGDHAGYRRSCAHMLACGQKSRMRAYLVARACTLAPDSIDDLAAVERLVTLELMSRRTEFWSLTEQGALQFRRNGPTATYRLEESLLVDGRPGRAVLNWLWLTLAYQQSKSKDEARRLLDKATRWLDQQEGQKPLDTAETGSHLHNWLEANVLRREAEMLLASPPSR